MATRLIASEGRIIFLRVHELGSRWGPPSDQIDVEVVARLSSVPDRAMGFQLRDDNNQPVRRGMLDLLRDAFKHDLTTRIDYEIDEDAGEKNGIVIRVTLIKPRTFPEVGPTTERNAIKLDVFT